MNDVLIRKIKSTTRDLESLMKRSKRKLFELETISSALEIVRGKGKKFLSARDLVRTLKK